MNAPAYYILTRMDVTGSSTSWHRAALIEAALAHLPEWWLVGTDYTRHWFAYGVGWSGRHADITNYYVRMAVDGGLPLLIAFVILLARAFAMVGTTWRCLARAATAPPHVFLPWALGASLLSHAASFVGVSYFDQSVVFLYVTLAGIASAAEPFSAPAEQHAAVRAASRIHRQSPLMTTASASADCDDARRRHRRALLQLRTLLRGVRTKRS